MAQCPVCEAPVHADFGLIECESCGVQLLVHVDGRVEHQGAEGKQVLGAMGGEEERPPAIEDFEAVNMQEPIAEEPLAEEPPAEEPLFQEREPEREFEFEKTPPPEGFDEEAALEATRMQTATIPPPEEPSEEFPDFLAQEEPATPAAPPDLEYNFDEPSGGGEPPGPVYVSAPSPDSPDLSDVARFGNSDLSGGRDGALRYTLFIEGIDTADVRAAFREAITDRKFVWDIDTILRSVRNGEVTIQNVAPTKAYILISRLRNLPVRVRWEQYALSQT